MKYFFKPQTHGLVLLTKVSQISLRYLKIKKCLQNDRRLRLHADTQNDDTDQNDRMMVNHPRE